MAYRAYGHAYTCLPDDDATVALQTMKVHKIRRRPVVDAEGHVRGILSLNDVVTHAGAVSPNEVVSTLASICEHRRPVAMAGGHRSPFSHRVSTHIDNIGEIVVDKDLKQHVQNALDWEPSVDTKDISVSVDEGVVTLRGNVASYTEVIAAERMALRARSPDMGFRTMVPDEPSDDGRDGRQKLDDDLQHFPGSSTAELRDKDRCAEAGGNGDGAPAASPDGQFHNGHQRGVGGHANGRRQAGDAIRHENQHRPVRDQ